MDTITIYRVEHKRTGIGPYNQTWDNSPGDGWLDYSPQQWRFLCAHGEDSRLHPPTEDDVPGVTRDHNFLSCFVSMRDLIAWFGGWLPVILRNGFEIVRENVPAADVYIGTRQAAYVLGMK